MNAPSGLVRPCWFSALRPDQHWSGTTPKIPIKKVKNYPKTIAKSRLASVYCRYASRRVVDRDKRTTLRADAVRQPLRFPREVQWTPAEHLQGKRRPQFLQS